MKRTGYNRFLDWKNRTKRHVLLVRGARQVGKTYLIREFGKTFDNFIEINFEKNKDLHGFFAGNLDPVEINKKIAGYFGLPINPNKTLLFFDEIQACPDAIRALRFYHEDIPNLHVVAAGSLLEFALENLPSFGVGRIESLFLYPMTFAEFLGALGFDTLYQMILQASPQNPMDLVLHQKALEIFKAYQWLGGMPEVVATYVEKNDYLACSLVLERLLMTLRDDFAKYKKKAPIFKLTETLHSVGGQTGHKFKYSNISETSTAQTHKDALDLLVMAGLVYKICHSHAAGIPLGAQVNQKKFKAVLFDTGIYHQITGLPLAPYLVQNNDQMINKGAAAEMVVGLELLAHGQTGIERQLHYWHRESPASNAEVDYVIQKQGQIIPIEVKSGTRGKMQSLHVFLTEKNLCRGVRVSHENFAQYGKIDVIPIYAIENLVSGK